ncbi:cyanophycin synthetase [Altericista sp. CCNU0014]|uniref:cyanophycin synthetase n=1 Tax=Altericista sp. CCNU0014 TaxID=3082949 RepID=UPI00384CA6EA
MKILQTKTLRGPNYWSIHRTKLVLVRLDVEDLADRRSNTLPGFYEGLAKTLPSLRAHICTPGCRGGFLDRVREGTTMGHILERVALELQTLAGMPVEFGRACETATTGVYQVVVEYQNEAAGRYATRAALRLCRSIVETGTYPRGELEKDLDDLARLKSEASLGASTEALVREAEALGIPWMHLETCDLFQLGYGKFQKRIQASLTSHSNVLGVELVSHKERTKKILRDMGVPVPLGEVIYAFRELEDAIHRLGGYPIVIKPLDGNHGRGITIDIQSWKQAQVAYDRAKDVSRGVIVEHFYQGRDHRILVVNHKVVAVAERVPAHVVGNGRSPIWALVERENQDSRRGEGHDNVLTHIQLDDATDEMLARQGYTLDTVLPSGQTCYLRATANLSTGGIAIDRTDEIHPDTVWLAERISRIVDLDVIGIDAIATDISKPLQEGGGTIVEVNAAPGLRMHVSPSQGMGRNVAAPILQMLFPPGTPTRIPIVAIAGTNGTATPTPLIAHMFAQVYEAVGFTTADGTYIENRGGPSVRLLERSDAANPQRARMILQDPTVEIAVLETAPDEILNSGLAFQDCNVGAILNVAADRLGANDRATANPMARTNAAIAKMVRADGYAVLNADDERVVAMAGQVMGKVAYFSMDADNPLVRSHVLQGGIAAVYEKGHLSILQQDWVHPIERAERISMALGGCAPLTIANALAASLTAFVLGVKVEQIRTALHSFSASVWQAPRQMPGQMELFDLDRYNFDPLKSHLDFKDEQVDFKDEQVEIRGELDLQPASLRSSALDASAIAPRNGLPHQNQDRAIGQERPLKEQVLGGRSYSDVEGYPTRQFIRDRNYSETQTELKDRPPEVATIATTPTENKPLDAPTFEANHTESPTQERFTARAADRGTPVKNWAEARGPGFKQTALNRLRETATQVFDIGEIIATVALAFGSVAAEMALQKGKELGAIAWGRWIEAKSVQQPVNRNC